MNGMPAARQCDEVAGGVIITGSLTVLIGSQGGVACSVCPGGMKVGSPVNPSLGAKVLSGASELDFALPGAMPLVWQRQYSSYVNAEHGGACGLLGYGWHLPFEMQLQLEADSTLLFDSNGRAIRFAETLLPGEAVYSTSEDLWLLRGGKRNGVKTEQNTTESTLQKGPIWQDNPLAAWIPEEWAQREDCIIATSGNGQQLWLFQPFSHPLLGAQRWLLQARRDRFGREQRYHYSDVEDVVRDSIGAALKLSYPWPLLTQITDGVGRRYQLHYGALHAKAWDAEPIKKLQEQSKFNPSQASASGFNGQAGWQPDSGWRLTQISVSDKYLSKQPLVQYGYSSAGDLVEVKDRYGRVTRRFAYKNHLMFAHQELQGPEHTYSYEADLPGAKVLNQYNEQGLDYQFIYQDQGERSTTQVIDSLGRVEHYFFEGQAGLKRLVKHQRFDGTQTKQQHDAYGRLTSSTDMAGRKSYLRRDSHGRLAAIQSAIGPAVAMRYNDSGLMTERRVDTLTTAFTYDTWQRVIAVTHPDGSTERFQYPDPVQFPLIAEQPIEIEDAQQGIKRLSWSSTGQLLGQTDCSQRTTSHRYNTDEQLISIELPNGEITRYQRDHQQRVESICYPDGSGAHYQYDEQSRVTAITPLNTEQQPISEQRINLQYDLWSRVTARMHAQTSMQFAYDIAGRLIKLVNENRATSTFDWDVMDRLIKEVGFDGRTQHYHYNELGLLTGHDDGQSDHWHRIRYSYDEQDRLSLRQWGRAEIDGQELFEQRLTWSDQHQLIQAQQYFGQDECAQLQTEALFEHDQLGRLVGETQRVWQSGADLQQPQLLHEYRLTHELDALGFRQRSHLPYAGEVSYLRYGSGHVHGILYNQQPLLDIQRDALHRETERHWVASEAATQKEQCLSRQQTWDSLGRLQQQNYQGLQLDNLSSFEPLVNLQQRHYHYDALGQLLKIEQPKQSQYYAYDPQGRLAGARLGEHGSPVESWQFDWAGNPLPPINAEQPKPQDWSERVRQHWQDPNFNLLGEGTQVPSEQVAYWPDNRVLYSADTQYQYDAQGNRTQHVLHNGETQRYYYNQLNQLQRVDRYSADNRLTRSLYRYDPLGRRLVKQVEHYRIDNNQLHEAAEPEVEFYGWDGDRLAFTQTADSQWHIIYEPESFTPLLQLQHATDAPISEQDKVLAEVMGSLQSTLDYLPAHEAYELSRSVREQTIAQLKANEQWQTPELPEECYFYHCNHLGLPEALTNQNGEAVWAASYDAWGTIKEEHNPNNLHQSIRLPGQYHDKETDLYYNRHRYYDPKLGSYISQDPIGLEGGDNYYNYALNLPTQLYDPTGLFIPLVVLAGIAGKALIGAAIGASVEVGVQAGKQVLGQVKENWDEGRPLFEGATDCIDIDWADVGLSAGVGAVAPGLFSTAKNVYKSSQAIKTLSGQAANTANRAAKLNGRINAHKSNIKKELMVQGGWQGLKQGGKCVFGEEKKPCEE